ncbi:hypothetical protein GQX74_006344 [Glossina fuscipes]|nr:hypothetical protein GQX74_006344 [Glossina fuscipes]
MGLSNEFAYPSHRNSEDNDCGTCTDSDSTNGRIRASIKNGSQHMVGSPLSSTCSLPKISSGGNDMHAAANHTNATHNIMRRGVRLTPYSNGLVIAKYRSTEIAHKFKMEAVQHSTSKDTQISHKSGPKFHFSNTS